MAEADVPLRSDQDRSDQDGNFQQLNIEEKTHNVTKSSSWSSYLKGRKRKIWAALAAAVVVVVVISLSVGLSRRNNDSTDDSDIPNNEAQTNQYIKTDNGLLINQNVCENSCRECEGQFDVDYIPYEAKDCNCDCEECDLSDATQDCKCEKCNPRVKSADCFMCNDSCLTPENITNYWSKSKRLDCSNSAPVLITCCLIARMKNMKKPSPLGMFECFTPEVQELYNISAIHPLFHCQYGKTGDACDKPNKVPFYCKCYTLKYDFNGQNEMMDCSKIPTTKECYSSINARKCVCTRRNETDSKTFKRCQEL